MVPKLPEARLVESKNSLVGLVAPETSVETVLFEVVNTGGGLEEGQLVEVQVGKRTATYQVVNGLTKEGDCSSEKYLWLRSRASSKNWRVGCSPSKRFRLVKWLPDPELTGLFKNGRRFRSRWRDAYRSSPWHQLWCNFYEGRTGKKQGWNQWLLTTLLSLGILGIGKSDSRVGDC